jgi:hypothetical protein
MSVTGNTECVYVVSADARSIRLHVLPCVPVSHGSEHLDSFISVRNRTDSTVGNVHLLSHQKQEITRIKTLIERDRRCRALVEAMVVDKCAFCDASEPTQHKISP